MLTPNRQTGSQGDVVKIAIVVAAAALALSACSSSEPAATDASVQGPSAAEQDSAPEAEAESTEPTPDETTDPADSPASVDVWQEPEDVLAGLQVAGFPCEWSGDGDQILADNPVTGQPAELVAIRCDGYGVALTKNAGEGWYSQLLPECRPLTEEDRSSPAAAAQIVLGSNFAILGSTQSGGFPAETPAEDFVAAFDGELVTFMDLYDRVCG